MDHSKLTYHRPRFADLIGKPFAYGGRGPDIFDCWGLLMEMHRRAYGIELPDYRSPETVQEIAKAMSADMHLWKRLEAPLPGSSILFRVDAGRESAGAHVGFQLDGMYFLHTWQASGGVLRERFDTHPWKNRALGHYVFGG